MPQNDKKDESVSIVDFVVEAIKEGIKDGHFVPGQRLVEADLTQRFEVSRGPLREALRRLSGDGLVVIEPHRGVTVRKLSDQDILEMFDVREAVESLAARLAAENIDKNDNRAKLAALMDEMHSHRKSNDVAGYTALNERFHDLIVTISGNNFLLNLIPQLRVPIFRYQFYRFMDVSSKRLSIAEHQALAKAILAGDAAKADKAMRKHIRQSGKLIRGLSQQV